MCCNSVVRMINGIKDQGHVIVNRRFLMRSVVCYEDYDRFVINMFWHQGHVIVCHETKSMSYCVVPELCYEHEDRRIIKMMFSTEGMSYYAVQQVCYEDRSMQSGMCGHPVVCAGIPWYLVPFFSLNAFVCFF